MSLSAQPTCSLLGITIEDIEPKKLGSTSYAKYVEQLTKTFRLALSEDGTCLIDILEAIKNCSKPCFKRDVLLEILSLLVNSPDSIIEKILHVDLGQSSRNIAWKNFANHIVTIPDVMANSDGLQKYPEFQAESFFSLLLDKLYDTLQDLFHKGSQLCDTQNCFYVQILGRIALSGCSQLVWDEFTSKLFAEQEEGLKSVISKLFTYPLQNHSQSAPQFELFIEPLYMPVFFNVKPNKDSGKMISSILGYYIHSNESFHYVVCDKCALQNNYKHDKSWQARTLFNIFSYLSFIMKPYDLTLEGATSSTPKLDKFETPDLLIKTLLEVAQSWSNGTKISFRSYEHSRYLTSAFIVAFRYAKEGHKHKILDKSEELQTCIMRGIPIYLNKSTSNYRNLALCIGETVLQALHELIDENSVKDLQQQQQQKEKSKEALKLDFGIELDEESQSMKRLFQDDLDEMFSDYYQIDRESLDVSKPTGASKDCVAREARSQTHSSTIEKSGELRKSCSSKQQSAKNSAKRAVVELDSGEEDDNLVPYELSDDSECAVDKDEVIGDDSMGIPIYLQDCIDGLAENSNPRYVRLCLMKADELVRQLSQQEALEDRSRLDSSSTENENILLCLKASDSFVNDAIRDCAIELAQLLLYLDDQYNLQEFDALRMNALSSLCVAAPDLVVKHLIDEFNGAHRSTRHQLDILQALVTSAKQLSGCLVDVDLDVHVDVDGKEAATTTTTAVGATSTSKKSVNKLVKYVSLYFYGIIHQLKAEPSYCISPATIVSTYDGDNRLDDSYLLGRIFFSISLIIECVHQQPITCKLSNDLIDLLANYRYHSDSGVRKAIVRCLKVVRDCTPSVYFKEYLEEKTSNLFNQWLANEFASLELLPPPPPPTTRLIRFS